ncbi:DUF2802 domain-containing protein [Oceanimonas baumannii]|uniref:Uncharacterized protein DUF2802 n=1 Tax=Oceanimonas baumannii TaxID=129578 RepID=A0A235CNI8_9GAMM|nr:DUF2802 domain-containing protein [Oceanimonas baumannii]OYD25934.1 hypothetical protein B6S09_03590 [Oceanimonas baumannii]TDW60048.1 uncharacterized protein DUF2802 [Oceanimonas baumannii]
MISETALLLALLALVMALAAIGIAWMMWRRSQRKLEAMSTLMRELARNRDSYRKQLEELQTANIGMGKKLNELGRYLAALREQQQELALKDPQSKLYSRAARMVQLGADIEEIMAECDMPRAEAELLLSLHRRR